MVRLTLQSVQTRATGCEYLVQCRRLTRAAVLQCCPRQWCWPRQPCWPRTHKKALAGAPARSMAGDGRVVLWTLARAVVPAQAPTERLSLAPLRAAWPAATAWCSERWPSSHAGHCPPKEQLLAPRAQHGRRRPRGALDAGQGEAAAPGGPGAGGGRRLRRARRRRRRRGGARGRRGRPGAPAARCRHLLRLPPGAGPGARARARARPPARCPHARLAPDVSCLIMCIMQRMRSVLVPSPCFNLEMRGPLSCFACS